MTNMTGSKLHIFTPRENNRLLDYYKIISILRPILPEPIWASTSSQANMGVSFLDVGSM
jgi:hypothetical protein